MPEEDNKILRSNQGGKNCMKNFSLYLRVHATKIINYEKKRNDTINKGRKDNAS